MKGLSSFFTGLAARWKAFSLRTKIIWGVVAIIVIGGVYLIATHHAAGPQTVTVTRGTVIEDVTVTGNTTPVGTVSLSFPTGGTIASVGAPIGATVQAGDVLATLDTSTLQAQLVGAEANVASAKAQLASLEAGATPAATAVSQAALNAANQQLANDYTSAYQTLETSYANSEDAVSAKLDSYLSNAEGPYPQLNFTTSENFSEQTIATDRPAAGNELLKWQAELATLNPTSPSINIDGALTDASAHIAVIQKFLTDMQGAAAYVTSFPPGSTNTQASLQAAVSASVAEENAAQTSVNTATQTIATQKAAVAEAQATLNQTTAGPTSYAVAAQEAAVEAAQATVDQINAQINQSILKAPISGTVSVQDAKVGEVASPDSPLVTIISINNLEVDADLPETDIGKVAVNDPVSITFDAFPNEIFTGTLYYIDPAETIIDGVVNYGIKVAFTKPDSRIKSGLTADLTITTATHANVLILPQFAIEQNDNGSFVEVQSGKTTEQVPVTTGIQDDAGNIEVTSGVTEDEKVLNIGLKTSGS